MKWLVLFLFASISLLCDTAFADDLNFIMSDSSFMVVSNTDTTISVTYNMPSTAAQALGVLPGTVLFEGSVDTAGYLDGQGYGFKAGCPPAPYAFEMKGRISMQGLSLYGASPIFAADSCAVVGYNSASADTALNMRSLFRR